MPESNMSLASSLIEENLKQSLRPNEYYIIKEDRQTPGFRTDTGLKELGTNILRSLLDYGQLRFHAAFFTCPSGPNLEKYLNEYKTTLDLPQAYITEAVNNPDSEARRNFLKIAVVQVKEELVRQLKDWKEEVVLNNRGDPKRFYSGKYGNKPDDMTMCLVGGMVMVKKYRHTVQESLEDISGMDARTTNTTSYGLSTPHFKLV
jgi:hypothetical protein